MTEDDPPLTIEAMPGRWLPALARIAGSDDLAGFLAAFGTLLDAAVPCDAVVLSCQFSAMAFERGVESIDPVLTDNRQGLTAQAVVMDLAGLPTALDIGEMPFLEPYVAKRGWTRAVTMSIPYRGGFGATAILYRRADQGDFDDATLRHLAWLQPVCAKALERLLNGQQAAALNRNLIRFLNDLPVGLIMLDWDWSLVFVNREGYRQALHWNHLPAEPPRHANARAEFVVPAILYSACNEFRNRQMAEPEDWWTSSDTTITVEHPSRPDLRASVTASRSLDSDSEPPKLLIRFFGMATRTDREFQPTPEQLKVLAQLTPTERTITLLVLQGMSNREIADRLHREISTVKDHLTHVFDKLAIRSRVQLVRLLSP